MVIYHRLCWVLTKHIEYNVDFCHYIAKMSSRGEASQISCVLYLIGQVKRFQILTILKPSLTYDDYFSCRLLTHTNCVSIWLFLLEFLEPLRNERRYGRSFVTHLQDLPSTWRVSQVPHHHAVYFSDAHVPSRLWDGML